MSQNLDCLINVQFKKRNKKYKSMYSLACNSHNFSNNEIFFKFQIKQG